MSAVTVLFLVSIRASCCAVLGLSPFHLLLGTQHSLLERFINDLYKETFVSHNPSEIILIC